jgi:hypothetical protein
MILDMAKTTAWGYGRIVGELRKLQICISRASDSCVFQICRVSPQFPAPPLVGGIILHSLLSQVLSPLLF